MPGYDLSAASSASSAASLSGATSNRGGLNFFTRGAGTLNIEQNKGGLLIVFAVLALVAIWLWRRK